MLKSQCLPSQAFAKEVPSVTFSLEVASEPGGRGSEHMALRIGCLAIPGSVGTRSSPHMTPRVGIILHNEETMNNHAGKQMTASTERCFQPSILSLVFMDSSCCWDIYSPDANVKHMVLSSRNTLSIKLCVVLSHAALSSEDALQHICRQHHSNLQKIGRTALSQDTVSG